MIASSRRLIVQHLAPMAQALVVRLDPLSHRLDWVSRVPALCLLQRQEGKRTEMPLRRLLHLF